jgi:hypothetical protein
MNRHRAIVKRVMQCEALADALLPAARQIGKAPEVQLLIAFRDVIFSHEAVERTWDLAKPLGDWLGVEVDESGRIIVNLAGSQLCGSVDLTRLPPGLEVLALALNLFEGSVDISHLPLSLTFLSLFGNSRLTLHSPVPSPLPKALPSRRLLKDDARPLPSSIAARPSCVEEAIEEYWEQYEGLVEYHDDDDDDSFGVGNEDDCHEDDE